MAARRADAAGAQLVARDAPARVGRDGGLEAPDERGAPPQAGVACGAAVAVAQGGDGRVVGALLAGQTRAVVPLSRAW